MFDFFAQKDVVMRRKIFDPETNPSLRVVNLIKDYSE
jgi:hypothetical protein